MGKWETPKLNYREAGSQESIAAGRIFVFSWAHRTQNANGVGVSGF